MTALMDAVAAATADIPRVFEVGSVDFGRDAKGKPLPPTYPYSVYSAQLGRGDSYLLDASEGVRWGRIVVQSFGKTANSAITNAEAHRAALVGLIVDVPGYDATSIQAEIDPTPAGRDPDDNGVVGMTATYTFTATKEQP